MEATGGARYYKVPVWLGAGVSAQRTGLWGIIAAGHRLGQLQHGWQISRGSGKRWEDQRGLPHLLPAGTVSEEEEHV